VTLLVTVTSPSWPPPKREKVSAKAVIASTVVRRFAAPWTTGTISDPSRAEAAVIREIFVSAMVDHSRRR
jgi:hypothetical protein